MACHTLHKWLVALDEAEEFRKGARVEALWQGAFWKARNIMGHL